MKPLFLLPVRLYRACISPLLAPRCRFYPTCSAYALQAVGRHGVLRGALLTAARLLSCHPWSRRRAEDPVPERFAWRQIIRYNNTTHP